MAETYPVGVISKLLDLSIGRIQVLVREGVIPRPKRGEYDLISSVHGYIKYLRGLADASGTPSLIEARRENVSLKNRLLELQYLMEQKKLISREEVLKEFLWRVNAVTQGLAALHRVLPPELAGKDPREMGEIVKKHIRELRERYSRPSGVLKEVMETRSEKEGVPKAGEPSIK